MASSSIFKIVCVAANDRKRVDDSKARVEDVGHIRFIVVLVATTVAASLCRGGWSRLKLLSVFTHKKIFLNTYASLKKVMHRALLEFIHKTIKC